MTLKQDEIDTKAAQLVLSARNAAARAAEEGSPSKLFRELGFNIGAGVALGMEDSAAQVVAAAEAIVRDAAAVVDPVGLVASAQQSSAAAGGLSVTFGPGSVVVHAAPGMTTEEARTLGSAIVDGAEAKLREREVAMIGRAL